MWQLFWCVGVLAGDLFCGARLGNSNSPLKLWGRAKLGLLSENVLTLIAKCIYFYSICTMQSTTNQQKGNTKMMMND